MKEKSISFKRNVIIPAGQSLILGIFLGGFVYILTKPRSLIPDVWGMGAGLLIASGAYALFSMLSYTTISKPQPVKTRVFDDEVRISLIDDTQPYKSGSFIQLSTNRNKLIQLAQEIESGKSFSGSSFGGKSKLFTRAQYEKLRDEFVLRGLAIWKDPLTHSLGLELTRGGRAFTRYFSEQGFIPPLSKDRRQFRLRHL